MNATTYGLDIAKSVFHMYWIEPLSGQIHSRRFNRKDLIQFLGTCATGRVALEACGGSHWWARKIQSLGHRPVLIHPAYVRSFVRTNKTDAADARAIWTAAQQPDMPSVPCKSEDQQALLALHRIRSELVDTRTRRINQLRGLLGEFGLHFVKGRVSFMAEVTLRRAEIDEVVPPVLLPALARQLRSLGQLDEQIR